jgi:LPXTG-motif cell wall-anchored protein
MAKKQKGRTRPKSKGNTWLLTGGLVLLLAAGGLFFLVQSRPAYGSLSDIGKGKPAIVDVFLPT